MANPNLEPIVGELTLEDIARQSGVSRSTVSRVINGHPNVSDKARDRVSQVIRSTGYQPNAAARSLASQRSWTIGLVLPHSVGAFFTDPYFPHLTQGIAHACNSKNYTLSLFLFGTREDEDRLFPRVARRGMLDGLLVQVGQVGDQLIDRLVASNVPVVILGRPVHAENVNYVDVDNENGAYNAVSHLIRLGYKRIANIAGPTNSTTGMDRMEGYRRALLDHERKVEDGLMISSDFTEVGGYNVMRQLLPARPDAVFAASDAMAIGAMRAVSDAGLRVPEDVAFVGFDDITAAANQRPQLTTVRQPIQEFGTRAVETLIDVIENGLLPARHVVMNTEFVIRSSCGASRRD